MNAYRPSIILLLFSIVFVACNSGNASKLKEAKHDTIATYTPPNPGQIPKAEFDRYYNGVKYFYENFLLKSGFNGGILVAKNGETIFEAYHGYSNLYKKDSITPHSAFHLASISKTFTAMATLKLVEMGKINLDDNVKKFFPDFPYENVTVKCLLSHRSGLPNYIYFMQPLGWDIKKYCSNQDVLDYMIKFKPPVNAQPWKHFEYCNTNYALLGLIIEKASGKSYADFLQTTFFTPLHMNDTYVFNMSDSATAMPSFDWRGRLEKLTYLDTGFGDKNVYSTPEDLLKWDQAMYTNEIFKKSTLDAAYTPYSNEKPGIRNYGYGWRMNVYPNGKKIIYHNGWWHGNNTVFIRMIQDSVTIIVLGNKFNHTIYQAKKMTELFEPSSVMEDDEKGNAKSDVLNTDHSDSLLNKKIQFAAVKRHSKKRHIKKR